jgi:hypothetical protein
MWTPLLARVTMAIWLAVGVLGLMTYNGLVGDRSAAAEARSAAAAGRMIRKPINLDVFDPTRPDTAYHYAAIAEAEINDADKAAFWRHKMRPVYRQRHTTVTASR